MGCKVLVALPLVVLLHFIERSAGRRSRRIEHPCAFGATPAPKTLFVDPYQSAAHGLPNTPRDLIWLCSCERRRSIGFSTPTATTRVVTQIKTGLHAIRSWRLAMARVYCLWGIQRGQEFLSQSEIVLELLNDFVALTGGFFEFPTVQNLHCTSHVIYNSLFLHE